MYDWKNPGHKIFLCNKDGNNIPLIKYALKVVDLKSQFNVERKELDNMNFSTLKLIAIKIDH